MAFGLAGGPTARTRRMPAGRGTANHHLRPWPWGPGPPVTLLARPALQGVMSALASTFLATWSLDLPVANFPADPVPGVARPAAAEDADPDAGLVRQIQTGDPAAFEALYARYQGPISRLVANMVRYPEAVPDLVQEIFAKAYFALDSFHPGLPFRPWLYRLASNHTIDFLRRQRRQPRAAEPPAPLDAGDSPREWDLPDPSAANALDRLVSRDLASKLLATLKPRDRHLLILQDLQDLSLEEISTATGLGLSAVKVGLFRARKRLLANYQKLAKKPVKRPDGKPDRRKVP